METGEFDYAWNTQVNPELQTQMAAGGKGHFVNGFGTLTERLEMNLTDPSADLPADQRSTVAHPHPILSDVNVRKALSMAIDRQALVDVGYGTAGKPTCNIVPAPENFASDNVDCIKQDMAGAKAMLDAAGWKVGANGIREKDGKKLHILYQSTVNPVRQDFQSLIKSWWTDLGVDVELKSIDASVFFGGDAGSPDTYQHFYADVEMFANNFDGTDPEAFLAQYKCDKIPSPKLQWQGENVPRFCDKAYDALSDKMSQTADMAERGKLAKQLNDIITKVNYATVPLVDRGRLSAVSNTLGGVIINVWDSELWNAQDWTRTK
jgi:peptide/nickel transport system substrate-binding protein